MRACLLVLLASSLPALAFAQTRSPEQEAQERYERGIKLFDAAKGDAKMYEAALSEFDAVYRLTHTWQVLFNVGVTQRKLGRLGPALRTFEQYLKEGAEQVPEARRTAVQKELAEIRALVAEVVVKVDGPPAELWLDGRPLGKSPLAEPLLLVSGTYGLRATRDGWLPVEKQLSVLSGNRYEVDLSPLPRPKEIAQLAVTATPADATVVLDQKPLGRAPWKGEVEPGGHNLLVEAEGYDPQSLDLVLAAGQTREVSVELVQPARFYQRWYFWTAVAVVAGGAAAGAYAYTHPMVDVSVPLP